MKLVPFDSKNKTIRGDDSVGIVATQYPTGNPDLSIARVKIVGRYPAQGWAMNTVSTMAVFVAAGSGSIVTEVGRSPIKYDDVVEIPAGEKYYWQADRYLILIPASSPAWTPEQHQSID
ncbi:MAG: cupin domain-containing protein [Candidatus Paceibacterota bacterium]|jgi:hypothetical protein